MSFGMKKDSTERRNGSTATDRVDLPLMVATGTVNNDVDIEVWSATVVEWSTE